VRSFPPFDVFRPMFSERGQPCQIVRFGRSRFPLQRVIDLRGRVMGVAVVEQVMRAFASLASIGRGFSLIKASSRR
jgi:hypothetical protein